VTAGDPLDSADHEILDGLAALYAAADPPPPDLDERVLFAIALEDVDVEVSRLHEDLLAGARGEERARTVTFDADSLTIMVTVTPADDGAIRLDGWLAPAAPLRVELRLATSPVLHACADEGGRFVFTAVPPGLAQLVVHPGSGAASVVVTPSIQL
jgi:hypothetical protein